MAEPPRSIDAALRLAWAVANTEAWRSSSRRIEPVHLYLGLLAVLDDAVEFDVRALGLGAAETASIAGSAAAARHALGVSDDRVTELRRALSRHLRQRPSRADTPRLHRSGRARDLFRRAAEEAAVGKADTIRLRDLAAVLAASPPEEIALVEAPRSQPGGAPGVPRPADWSRSDALLLPAGGSSTPVLDRLGRDLTALARHGRLAPVVGRSTEMRQLARYLMRTTKANAILVGDAGVGKTAVVEGLAQRAAGPDAPEELARLRIVEVSVASLVSGTTLRGDLEQRLEALVGEVTDDPDVVLFLDEIHLVMRAGGGDASLDVANILKPALAREGFRCIGATTTDEFERHIAGDAAFMRRFQVLRVPEPSTDEALEVCRTWARRIEEAQYVTIEESAVVAAVELSNRLLRRRSLPDKAIDLLENAATVAKVSSLTFRGGVPEKRPVVIDRGHIERVLEEQYGVAPRAASVLDASAMQALLGDELVGQDDAVSVLADTVVGLSSRDEDAVRPLGVFLFTGPTGVGKTHAAEAMARALFPGHEDKLGRFNMSEFKERHELARLIGAPPGFVGHENQGALFRFADVAAQGLVLLDEMEKAHPEIQDYFLQIFDKGEARDSRGQVADFRRHVFVMTCNVGSEATRQPLGFARSGRATEAADLEPALLEHFRPEFLGRIDRVVQFRKLAEGDYGEILARSTRRLQEDVDRRFGRAVAVADEVVAHLASASAHQGGGARACLRLFERLVAGPVMDAARSGTVPLRVRWAGEVPEVV